MTIEADIIKQKQPENNGGYNAVKFGKTDPRVYCELTTLTIPSTSRVGRSSTATPDGSG